LFLSVVFITYILISNRNEKLASKVKFKNILENQKIKNIEKIKNKEVEKTPEIKVAKKYLLNFDGSESKVEIQCLEDGDCVINKDIFNPCGFPQAINKNNTQEDINEYSKKEEKLTEMIDVKCASLDEYQEKAFCNKENICEVMKKNEE
jgi:hypothetical protein